jgi:uncharacterized SAM-binding protein YcdF (DUF218 family)
VRESNDLFGPRSGLADISDRRGKVRWIHWLLIGFAFAALVSGAWLQRETLLRSAADLWIISDPVTPGDAVVVLGGGIDVRPFVAADLYNKGLVRKVLLSQVEEDDRIVNLGIQAGHTELNRQVLLRLGVPDTVITKFGTANRNTKDEAVALKDWADRNPVSVLIIPTDRFSARRVRWIFLREFYGRAVRIEVPSYDDPSYEYTRSGWWKTEHGWMNFQNEIFKYLYYRFTY